ncbi:MAG TPA: hypothetical protein VJP76_07740 [Candidatus Tumulicola sp.]|nr:hypothetical protein [Candidatus Tumulicola sp.]
MGEMPDFFSWSPGDLDHRFLLVGVIILPVLAVLMFGRFGSGK